MAFEYVTPAKAEEILFEIGMNRTELAQTAKVSMRTVRRWLDENEILPGPVRAMLDAFSKCHKHKLDYGNRVFFAAVMATVNQEPVAH